MDSALSANSSEQTYRQVFALRNLWPSECISVGLFAFLALLAAFRHQPVAHVGTLLSIAALSFAGGTLEYAVDGVASIAIAALASLFTQKWSVSE